mgnify:CR=1 FL=1
MPTHPPFRRSSFRSTVCRPEDLELSSAFASTLRHLQLSPRRLDDAVADASPLDLPHLTSLVITISDQHSSDDILLPSKIIRLFQSSPLVSLHINDPHSDPELRSLGTNAILATLDRRFSNYPLAQLQPEPCS